MAGLSRSQHYGVIIMDRIFPVYDDKISFNTHLQKVVSEKYDQTIKQALKQLHNYGITAQDLDFFIDKNGSLRFLDLDFWILKNSQGCWRKGQLCP